MTFVFVWLKAKLTDVPPPRGGRRPGRDDVDALRARAEVVREEPELLQVARAHDALLDEPRLFVRRESEALRQREPVGQRHPEIVRRQQEGPEIQHGAGCEVAGLLGVERNPSPERRDFRGGRDGAAVHEIPEFAVEEGRHVEGVLLAGRGRAEAGAQAAAQGEVAGEPVASRELAVQGGSEVLEVLEAQGAPSVQRSFR